MRIRRRKTGRRAVISTTAEQDTAQCFGRRNVSVMVIAEIGRRTASYDGGHDLSSLAENHLFDISLCAGLVAYMSVAVVAAIRKLDRKSVV